VLITIALRTRRDTRRLAGSVARILAAGDLLLMAGELGTGKTFFVRAMARTLGVQGSIVSPSFTLVNEYLLPGGGTVLHVDLYRLLGSGEPSLERDVAQLGLRERRLDGSIVVVEWGDAAISALGGNVMMRIGLAIGDSGTRSATLSGPRAGGIVP
jgi:tRNA threonylcarbamoyladenosine biosynthesis protein TsaE